jgi:hypothetical protein
MANSLESNTFPTAQTPDVPPSGWVKLGAIAAASALVGGLAAAWWYRKTLTKLHQTGETAQNSDFGISGEDPEDDA